jgi:transposase
MADDSFPGWQAEKTIRLVTREGMTQVFVKGRLYMSWRCGDEECLRLAMVQIHQCGLGTEEELAGAFGRHVNSVQRYLAGFAEGGVRGLLSERSGPKGPWKITPELRGKILWIALKEGVGTLEVIQQRLADAWQEEVSVSSIQQVLAENGLGKSIAADGDAAAVQSELFGPPPDQQLWLRLESGSGRRSPSTGIGSPEVETGSGSQPCCFGKAA